MTRQATFGDYDATTDGFPGVSRDEWGPTARRPVPEPEAKRSALRGWLAARGFNLDCIREAEGIIPSRHTDHHPADEPATWELPGRLLGDDSRREEIEALIAEDLADLSRFEETMQDDTTTDDGRSITRGNGSDGDPRAQNARAVGRWRPSRPHRRKHLPRGARRGRRAEPLDQLQADDEPTAEERTAEDDGLPGEYHAEAETVGEGWEGEFIYSSWGYGQTNVEMAMIVDVSDTGKTVLAQLVAPETVDHGRGSESLRPTGETYGDEFRLHVRGWTTRIRRFAAATPSSTATARRGPAGARLAGSSNVAGDSVHQTATGFGH
ncbi:MAG: hypothetical protein U5J98_07015 [Halobacteriales archaeon]|nr:hypothetical protein [Halobacteriales archaeon]